MKVIFLDIDGVLNGHDAYDWDLESKALISQRCVAVFNCIVAYTGAKVVLSSTWRYMVHNGNMDVRGFEQLLRSHGVRCELLGVTCTDEEHDERGNQIKAWLSGKYGDVESYVVIDDMSDEFMAKLPFVQTDGRKGLTQADARKACEILGVYPEYRGTLS